MRTPATLLTLAVGTLAVSATVGVVGGGCENCNAACLYSQQVDIIVPPDRRADVTGVETEGACTPEVPRCAEDAGTPTPNCGSDLIVVHSNGSGSCTVTVHLRGSPDFVAALAVKAFDQSCGCRGDLFIDGPITIPSLTDGGTAEGG